MSGHVKGRKATSNSSAFPPTFVGKKRDISTGSADIWAAGLSSIADVDGADDTVAGLDGSAERKRFFRGRESAPRNKNERPAHAFQQFPTVLATLQQVWNLLKELCTSQRSMMRSSSVFGERWALAPKTVGDLTTEISRNPFVSPACEDATDCPLPCCPWPLLGERLLSGLSPPKSRSSLNI